MKCSSIIAARKRDARAWAHGLRRRDGSAFTLVELMIVLVLMAIMAAMIVPEMRGTFEHELLRSTSRQLIRACQLASSQSVTVHQRHRVWIDRREGRYTVERWAGSPESEPGFQALPNLPDSSGRLDGRVRVDVGPLTGDSFFIPDPELSLDRPAEEDVWSSAEAILFYPDGRAEAKELRLQDRQGFQMALRINPVNGRVHIVEEGIR